MIRCRDLVVAYGSLVAVNGLTLDIYRGECFGLLGPNGAGKTTAVEVFEGLLSPRSGTVEILGKSGGGAKPATGASASAWAWPCRKHISRKI